MSTACKPLVVAISREPLVRPLPSRWSRQQAENRQIPAFCAALALAENSARRKYPRIYPYRDATKHTLKVRSSHVDCYAFLGTCLPEASTSAQAPSDGFCTSIKI